MKEANQAVQTAEPHEDRCALLKQRIKALLGEATPAEPTITVKMKLSPMQAKAVFDALAALSERARDA